MEGVLDTRSGWIDQHEVVTVRFDPRSVSYARLLKAAKEEGCASRAWWTSESQRPVAQALLPGRSTSLPGNPRDAKDSDQLYYLERSPYARLPLTPLQARRINGALYVKEDPAEWLSPRQRALLDALEKAPGEVRSKVAELERSASIEGLRAHQRRLEALLAKR